MFCHVVYAVASQQPLPPLQQLCRHNLPPVLCVVVLLTAPITRCKLQQANLAGFEIQITTMHRTETVPPSPSGLQVCSSRQPGLRLTLVRPLWATRMSPALSARFDTSTCTIAGHYNRGRHMCRCTAKPVRLLRTRLHLVWYPPAWHNTSACSCRHDNPADSCAASMLCSRESRHNHYNSCLTLQGQHTCTSSC